MQPYLIAEVIDSEFLPDFRYDCRIEGPGIDCVEDQLLYQNAVNFDMFQMIQCVEKFSLYCIYDNGPVLNKQIVEFSSVKMAGINCLIGSSLQEWSFT